VVSRQRIEGVEIKRLTTHADERGSLTELLRGDVEFFVGLGQCYVYVS
jgi:dTDP-4-dehydrorhamnose 3,5-epimerase